MIIPDILFLHIRIRFFVDLHIHSNLIHKSFATGHRLGPGIANYSGTKVPHVYQRYISAVPSIRWVYDSNKTGVLLSTS